MTVTVTVPVGPPAPLVVCFGGAGVPCLSGQTRSGTMPVKGSRRVRCRTEFAHSLECPNVPSCSSASTDMMTVSTVEILKICFISKYFIFCALTNFAAYKTKSGNKSIHQHHPCGSVKRAAKVRNNELMLCTKHSVLVSFRALLFADAVFSLRSYFEFIPRGNDRFPGSCK